MKSVFTKIMTALSLVYSFNVQSTEISGFLGIDTVHFTNTDFTTDEIFSAVGEVRSRDAITENLNYEVRLYGNKDVSGAKEGYFDPTIAKLSWLEDSYQIDLGYDLVYWGVTEGINIVNIVNQRDQIRDYFLKQGLGQSMAAASYFGDDITVSAYILPKFEELNFSGTQRPWGLGLPVDDSQSTYESSREEYHTDYAARLAGVVNDLEYGLIYFNGTYRKPLYNVDTSKQYLVPHYIQGTTLGLDAQYIMDSNIYKLEFGYFKPDSFKSYVSTAFGLERTLNSPLIGNGDSTFYLEYYYDSRQNDQTVSFQNDLFIAYKHSTHNAYDIETTIGGIIDTEYGSVIGTFDISGKITNEIKASLEFIYFRSTKYEDALFNSRNFDQVSLSLDWYY